MQANARFVVVELVRWLGVYALYLLGREVAITNGDAAVRHTEGLVAAERALGIFREEVLQDGASWTPAVGRFFEAYYMVGFAPVCVAALLWTACRHRETYLELRRRLFLALALALPCFLLFPAAPPRLVAGLGIADTVGLDGHDTGSFLAIRFNPYAALPSLHVGWSLLLAFALVPLVRRRRLRAAIWAHPLLMTVAVVATGNHLFLDVFVGVVVALIARALAAVPLAVLDPSRAKISTRIRTRILAVAMLSPIPTTRSPAATSTR
jgi:hypothetical protein